VVLLWVESEIPQWSHSYPTLSSSIQPCDEPCPGFSVIGLTKRGTSWAFTVGDDLEVLTPETQEEVEPDD